MEHSPFMFNGWKSAILGGWSPIIQADNHQCNGPGHQKELVKVRFSHPVLKVCLFYHNNKFKSNLCTTIVTTKKKIKKNKCKCRDKFSFSGAKLLYKRLYVCTSVILSFYTHLRISSYCFFVRIFIYKPVIGYPFLWTIIVLVLYIYYM